MDKNILIENKKQKGCYKQGSINGNAYLSGYILYNDIIYLNFSFYHPHAGLVPVALMVMHSSDKRGLSGHPGSIPGWGGPALNSSNFKSEVVEYNNLNGNKQ